MTLHILHCKSLGSVILFDPRFLSTGIYEIKSSSGMSKNMNHRIVPKSKDTEKLNYPQKGLHFWFWAR